MRVYLYANSCRLESIPGLGALSRVEKMGTKKLGLLDRAFCACDNPCYRSNSVAIRLWISVCTLCGLKQKLFLLTSGLSLNIIDPVLNGTVP